MSESRPPPTADDRYASAANAFVNEGENEVYVSEATRYQMVLCQLQHAPRFSAEWFRLKEEEIQLRTFFDVKDHSIKFAEAGEDDDLDVGKANADRSVSFSDRCSLDMSRDTSSTLGGFRHTPNSQEGEKMFADANLDTIVSTNPTRSSASVTEIVSDSLIVPPQRSEGMAFTGHLKLPSVNMTGVHDLQGKFVPKTNVGIETALKTLDSDDDEPPHVPRSLLVCHKLKDGQVSKDYVRNTDDDDGPPVPFAARFDLFSGIKPTRPSKPEQSATSMLHQSVAPLQLAAAPPDFATRDQGSTAADATYGLHTSDPVNQAHSNFLREVIDEPVRALSNEHEDEKNEDMILIPEAFLVEANVPVEVPFAAVAEIVGPDQITFSSKKLRTGVLLVIFAAITIALGTAIPITRDEKDSNIQFTETNDIENRSFLPSSQATSQPSLSISYEIRKNVLRRNVTFEGSRELAFNWLTSSDELQLDAPDAYLYQRYILALLSYEFWKTGFFIDESVGWRSGKHECEWPGVECDNNRYVSKLDLGKPMF